MVLEGTKSRRNVKMRNIKKDAFQDVETVVMLGLLREGRLMSVISPQLTEQKSP